MRIVLLFGGRSAEHDVSLVSADYVRGILQGSGHEVIPVLIDRDGSWSTEGDRISLDSEYSPWRMKSGGGSIGFDLVFPVLHGPFGEDGTVQGLCSMAGWACAGAGVMTSSIAMNKVASKEIAAYRNIPVMPWKTLTAEDPLNCEAASNFQYPIFVKPAGMGSSVGITRVGSPKELVFALKLAFEYDDLVLLEPAMKNAREIEVALLSEGGEVSSSVAGEVVPGLEWYDYRAKYNCDDSRLLIPASIPKELSKAIRRDAEKVFTALRGSGYARADFLLDRKGSYCFNEINTIPGFTEISMFPKLWKASGVEPEELMERIMDEALREWKLRTAMKLEHRQ